MHLMRKNARDKVSFAPVSDTAVAAETSTKSSSPSARAKERASLMAALFASKVKRLAEPVATTEARHNELLASAADNDDDDEFLDGDDDHSKKLQSAKQLERQLQTLAASSAESEEAWRRENARLREQLAAASKREVAQIQQLKSYEAQLAGCKQELEQLRKLAATESPPSPAHSTTNDALLPSARERELLRLVIELVGKASILERRPVN
ncbi:hypothetical protein Gpo141_00013391 [Globisporangium polare]